ncbi:MAG: bifunctional hydroxymethylpyrimidine kinase/phosphomethylpyrimidine kinase [Desulfuromonadaceae bacterium]|nr:bifunctional hydroxymethylpyrimidine kinase/phosphomethylpyrimidine kinase [Desulfuromonadaceae bacterium]
MSLTMPIQHTISGLYLITDDSEANLLLARCEQALRGGVRLLQYRDKKRPFAKQCEIAGRLKQLCQQHGALLIINDQIELARIFQADGLHLGQKDTALAEARAQLGPDCLIGVSTRTPEQALAAQQQGADYIGVGSVYPTATKQDAVHIGLNGLKAIRAAVELPIVAIGGISAAGLPAAIDAGADAAAVISAVMADPQPDCAARELSLLFRRRQPLPCGSVLTVAGSDSSGGAGIQADLKTISLLGSYGSSVITALTAQNTLGVRGIHAAPVDFVRQQLRCVLDDIGADVIKTGMLFSGEIIRAVAEEIASAATLNLVDPVMIAKGGASLLHRDAVDALLTALLPKTYLLTPNVPEAEALTGLSIRSAEQLEQAACALQQMGARHVLVKGGHLPGAPTDLLRIGSHSQLLTGPRIDSRHTHGTGCTTASALATLLSQGWSLEEAARHTKFFIEEAIRSAPQLGQGHGPINHFIAAQKLRDRLARFANREDIEE